MMSENANFEIDPNNEKEGAMELIQKLPPELGKRWIEELNGGKNPSEIKLVVEEIIAEREKIKKERFPGLEEERIFNESLNEKERKNFDEKIKEIAEETLENKKISIGEGRSAKVITSQIDSTACFKIIYNIGEYKKGNTVKKETELLEVAIKANKTKVKLPEPYYYKMDKNTHLYVMEKLDAVTLGEVMRGEKDLPEKFDFEIFFKELNNFVENIHQENIYHRDLLENNIMIDLKTGLPCVIDLGCSTINYSSDIDEIYRGRNEITMEKDNFSVDETAILENKNNFKNFLNERGNL